jgi:hypothetical protein
MKSEPADWSGRCLTPGGSAGQVRPRRRKPRRLNARPPESKHLERKTAFSLPFQIKNEKSQREKNFSSPFVEKLKSIH